MFFEGNRIDAMREMILADTRNIEKRRWPDPAVSTRRFRRMFRS